MADAGSEDPGWWKTAALVALVAALAVVGFFDSITGRWASFVVFYVAPVLLASWFLRRGPAFVAAFAAAAAWFFGEDFRHPGEPGAAVWWNALSRLALLSAMAAMMARIRADQRRLRSANHRLAELLEAAERQARTDALTGLPNRLAFLERLEDELSRARRSKAPVCVAYVDVDNFKRLNDAEGHPAGDELLRELGRLLRESVRAADVPARLGGDEFAVLLVDAQHGTLQPLAERLLAAGAGLGARHPGLELGVSIGIAWSEEAPASAAQLLQHADAALYEAKVAGKHRFALWTPATGGGPGADRPADRS